MDARIDVYAMLGLTSGEAHVLRNAGGVVTYDTVRSLCLSHRLLGTNEIFLVHHTRCGLQDLDAHAFTSQVEEDTGVKPPWPIGSFSDPYRDVTQSIQRLRQSPFIRTETRITEFVLDIDTARLHRLNP